MKILFMGTPDFAAVCLDALLSSGKEVAAVVTQPDKRQGRGMKVAFNDVKQYALAHDIPVFQPETLRDEALLPLLEQIQPEVIAVVAYGKILPPYVLHFPKYGCINVHGSLLPKYRGAAPIQRAVMNGEAVTGITTMRMDEGMDTGDMLLTEQLAVGETVTAGELFDMLAPVGGRLLVQTLDALEAGTLTPTPQPHALATYADKITNEECLVDFSAPAREVHNKIRGLSPFPGAFAYLDGKVVKLYESRVGSESGSCAAPGTVLSASAAQGVQVVCGSGTVFLGRFKPEGKGMLSAADMINGRKLAQGSRFCLQKEER